MTWTAYLQPDPTNLSGASVSRGSGGEGGGSQVLSKRVDIVFKKAAPEIVAHVAIEVDEVSSDLGCASL